MHMHRVIRTRVPGCGYEIFSCPDGSSMGLVHRRLVQRFQQFRPRLERLGGLLESHPLPAPLLHLGPVRLHLLDRRLEEPVDRGRRLCRDLVWFPLLIYTAQILGDLDDDARLLPSLTGSRVGLAGLVRLPAALGQDPGTATGGGDEEDVVLVGGEGDDAGDKTFALGTVACAATRRIRSSMIQEESSTLRTEGQDKRQKEQRRMVSRELAPPRARRRTAICSPSMCLVVDAAGPRSRTRTYAALRGRRAMTWNGRAWQAR